MISANPSTELDLYLLQKAGEKLGRITRTDGPAEVFPAWTPDGSIVYARSDAAGSDLWTVGPDGGAAQPFLVRPGNEYSPAFSTDGKSLAFSDDGRGIVVLPLDGSGPERKLTAHEAFGPWATSPSWSPDGQWIAYAGADESGEQSIFRVRPDGTGLERLTEGTPAMQSDSGPAFSPDGRRLAFSRSRASVGIGLSELYVLDLATRELHQLTEGSHDKSSRWSADGSRILFVRELDDEVASVFVVAVPPEAFISSSPLPPVRVMTAQPAINALDWKPANPLTVVVKARGFAPETVVVGLGGRVSFRRVGTRDLRADNGTDAPFPVADDLTMPYAGRFTFVDATTRRTGHVRCRPGSCPGPGRSASGSR